MLRTGIAMSLMKASVERLGDRHILHVRDSTGLLAPKVLPALGFERVGESGGFKDVDENDGFREVDVNCRQGSYQRVPPKK